MKIIKLVSDHSVQNYTEKLKEIQVSYICGLWTLVNPMRFVLLLGMGLFEQFTKGEFPIQVPLLHFKLILHNYS